MRRRLAARLVRRRRTALAGDPNRHEAWRLNACCRRELVPPHREQPADNAIAPSDLGNIGAFLEALRYDPCLLFRRPLPPPALSGDQLDTTIRTAFLPDIMHGICHRFTPNDQLMPSCIADQAHHREVGASYRLPSTHAQSFLVVPLVVPGGLINLELCFDFIRPVAATFKRK